MEPPGDFSIPEIPVCGVGKTSNCTLANIEQRNRLFDRLKKSGYKYNPQSNKLEKLPKFKVGDRIKHKTYKWFTNRTIKSYTKDIGYFTTMNDCIRIENQDDWELVPNKFDITTLVPFESRVLVRDIDHNEWEGAVFGRYDGNMFFTIGGIDWKYCIPYEGNEHLLGKTNDCDEFYKIW